MEWTNYHDVLLCREILVTEPYTAKPRTTQRGQLWNTVADHLNTLGELKFNVTQRAVRDRFKLLSEKFKKKIAAEERATGIDPEVSELDVLLEEILAKEEASNEKHSSNAAEKKKKEVMDKENAEDLRLKAMDSLKETQKRKVDCSEVDRRVKRRSNGSEAVQYLRERMNDENVIKQHELELKRKDMSRSERKQEYDEDDADAAATSTANADELCTISATAEPTANGIIGKNVQMIACLLPNFYLKVMS